MVPARADRAEAPRRRIRLAARVTSPALDRARLAQPAAIVPARADRAEAPRRRVRLAVRVTSPALDRAGLVQPAGVSPARSDLHEAGHDTGLRLGLGLIRGQCRNEQECQDTEE